MHVIPKASLGPRFCKDYNADEPSHCLGKKSCWFQAIFAKMHITEMGITLLLMWKVRKGEGMEGKGKGGEVGNGELCVI